MKRYVLLLSLSFISSVALAAPTQMKQIWDQSNQAYANANYVEAIEGYESIISQGWESDHLYNNLGNAYYKRGMVGKSILSYNRALRLSPSNGDVIHNLQVANTLIQDNIEVVPVFFLKSWINSLRLSITSSGWAIVTLFMLCTMLGSILFYLLSENISYRKAGFCVGIGASVLLLFSVVFAAEQYRSEFNSSEAIVMSGAVTIKSSPEAGSKDVFILHQGTKVKIKSILGQYREIVIADGRRGWIEESNIECIN